MECGEDINKKTNKTMTKTPRFFCEQVIVGTYKEWLDDFVYLMACYLKNNNFAVIPFDGNNLSTLDLYNPEKIDYLVGSVEATAYFFNLIGVETPKYLGYPKELENFFRREFVKTTVDKLPNTYPYFFKPANDVKKFNGEVIDSESKINFAKTYTGLSNSEEVYYCKVMNFISEYRCFVLDGELVGVKHYKGDFTKFIDMTQVHAAIAAYKNAPSAYTLDFGVYINEDVYGGTALVEVNDFWAMGSYGLDPQIYKKMLVRRFNEIKTKIK